jgi:hypothetical protein
MLLANPTTATIPTGPMGHRTVGSAGAVAPRSLALDGLTASELGDTHDRLRLTKQGVRALGVASTKPAAVVGDCDHRAMADCCTRADGRPCGHLICGCGLSWDDAAEG